MNQIKQTSLATRLVMRWEKAVAIKTCLKPSRWLLIMAVLASILTQSVQAQTARFRSPNHRVTVPLGFSGTYVFTNTCAVASLVNPARFDISGLPSGVTYSVASTNGALTLDGGFPSTLISTNLLITLTFDGTESQGITTANLNSSGGAVNNWSFSVQVAALWSGASYLSGVSSNWNDAGNWVSGSAPGANDDVVLGQSGATNANTISNVIMTASTTVSSLRFAPTNSTFKFYTFQFNPGVTLGVGGANGFSMMKDVLNVYTGLGGMTVTMRGEHGTLAVTNTSANIFSYIDNAQASVLDLSGLGTFVADVSRIGLADYSLWPYYRNLNDQNNYGGQPRQALPTVSLARTNIIKTAFIDPNNYANSDSRQYGFSFMQATELSGSGTAPNLNLGITNVFYVDGACLVGASSRGNVQFNSAFNASNPVAIFRGTNGGRMSVFTISDGAGTNTTRSNIKATINFLAGTLDMLCDRFYVGRDRVKIESAQSPNYQGTFFMGKGILDVNTMILGFREHAGELTNAAYAYAGYCEGQLTISNTGVARINKSLTLGYTTESNPNGWGSAGNTEYGQVTIRDGATVLANTINVGGPVYGASRNNFIFVTNNASLSVSNYIAGPNQSLDFITFANGSTLTLTLNATSTVAALYATNFNMVGSNSFVLAGIKNPGSLVNGLQIPLFKRSAGGAPNFTVFNLSGVNGQIVTDGSDANQQNFQVILNTPKNLVWKGYSSANWDNVTANWLDTATLLHTNFAAGDSVTFDDSASQYSITLDASSVILPGAIVMANTNNSYNINNSGGGSIIGSATLTKSGTNSLVIDASTSISVILNAGALTGSGSLASVTINTGSVMNFTGSIAGNLSVAGLASSSGTVNGALLVQAGGVVTNLSVMNSTLTVANGGVLVNALGASFVSIGASSAVNAGGTFINRGSISGGNLSISGTFKDTGEGVTTLTGTFTANTGSTIIPGGDGVGTTTIQSGVAAGFPGRVLLSQGSTNIFKVDIIGNTTSRLLSGYQDFGSSSSVRSQTGCTILITNVTGAFAVGQAFTLFQYYGGGNPSSTGTSTNTYPVIVPSTPGAGLAWDLTQLWPAGVVGVTSNTGPVFTNVFTVVGGTNIIGEFSWDIANYGWRLQNKSVAQGEGVNSTNPWTGINGSWTNTVIVLTNTITTNNVFYRLVYP